MPDNFKVCLPVNQVSVYSSFHCLDKSCFHSSHKRNARRTAHKHSYCK